MGGKRAAIKPCISRDPRLLLKGEGRGAQGTRGPVPAQQYPKCPKNSLQEGM